MPPQGENNHGPSDYFFWGIGKCVPKMFGVKNKPGAHGQSVCSNGRLQTACRLSLLTYSVLLSDCTFFLNWLEAEKQTFFLTGTKTFSPVLGLRAILAFVSLIVKIPRSCKITRSPLQRASSKTSEKRSKVSRMATLWITLFWEIRLTNSVLFT